MASEPNSAIDFADVTYRVPGGGPTLLSGLTLSVQRGETLMLLGRSGSGKTTCLKMINRLLTPTAGEIRVDDTPLGQWDPIKLRRRIGYAIQDVGLFPHYSVRDNVALVPRLEEWDARKITQRVEEVLALVGLPSSRYADRYPDELSGGQRQRVGLARALAAEPPILLMDEPFGALDPITRAELQMEFKKLQEKLGKTIVFVTHDVSEALLLGSRIALVEEGKLRGVYRPQEFLDTPDPSVKAYVDVFRAGQHLFATESREARP
jgi:osmoprotectant transport system ATP-binding protein